MGLAFRNLRASAAAPPYTSAMHMSLLAYFRNNGDDGLRRLLDLGRSVQGQLDIVVDGSHDGQCPPSCAAGGALWPLVTIWLVYFVLLNHEGVRAIAGRLAGGKWNTVASSRSLSQRRARRDHQSTTSRRADTRRRHSGIDAVVAGRDRLAPGQGGRAEGFTARSDWCSAWGSPGTSPD